MLATDKWKVSLTLDKADCVYYAGQEIAGIARVELDEPIHVIGEWMNTSFPSKHLLAVDDQ